MTSKIRLQPRIPLNLTAVKTQPQGTPTGKQIGSSSTTRSGGGTPTLRSDVTRSRLLALYSLAYG